MLEEETAERREWKEAKKSADSLSLSFKDLGAARKREADARRRYMEAPRPQQP